MDVCVLIGWKRSSGRFGEGKDARWHSGLMERLLEESMQPDADWLIGSFYIML
jgi:hypothetical protein